MVKNMSPREGPMNDPQDCWNRLRDLTDSAGDPRDAAAAIVREYAGGTGRADVERFHVRLEDTLLAGKYTIVPLAYLDQHRRWLAVLEGACAAMRRELHPS
jgi:hypothetical protein